MRAASRPATPPPSMFNFLSVLVCLLGSLMLMAVGLTALTIQEVIPNVYLDIVVAKVPVVVDCTAESGKTLDEAWQFSPQKELRGLLQRRLEESAFLRFVKQLRKNEFVFFVVRPSGIITFTVMQGMLDYYNDIVTSREVMLTSDPDESELENLSRTLRKKISLRGSHLKFRGRMTLQEMLQLRQLFANRQDQRAVELLYRQSQDTDEPLAYALEIVPEDWTISLSQEAQERKQSDGNR